MAFAGCAHQPYTPLSADPAALQSAWLNTRTDDETLRAALQRHGVDVGVWPLPAWDLRALTVLAGLRHPDMAVARAELVQAETARLAARDPAQRLLDATLEHHSASGATDSPWTLGLVFDGVFLGRARQAALGAQADAVGVEAAQLAAGAAWRVRQRVRAAYEALREARAQAALADAAAPLWADESAAWRRRLELGAASTGDLQPALKREADARAQRLQAHRDVVRRADDLAAAVGLSSERFAALPLRFETIAAPSQDAQRPSRSPASPGAVPDATPEALLEMPALQRAALTDRLDVRAQLARCDAADAALRAELARQWPEWTLKPGYSWDQGDNRWALGLGVTLPPGGRNQHPIALALARREAEARRAAALQADAVAELDAARREAAQAAVQRDAAQAALDVARRDEQRAERQLAAGSTDRLELNAQRLARLDAERRVLDADSARRSAFAALEDAVQRPLDDIPFTPGS